MRCTVSDQSHVKMTWCGTHYIYKKKSVYLGFFNLYQFIFSKYGILSAKVMIFNFVGLLGFYIKKTSVLL